MYYAHTFCAESVNRERLLPKLQPDAVATAVWEEVDPLLAGATASLASAWRDGYLCHHPDAAAVKLFAISCVGERARTHVERLCVFDEHFADVAHIGDPASPSEFQDDAVSLCMRCVREDISAGLDMLFAALYYNSSPVWHYTLEHAAAAHWVYRAPPDLAIAHQFIAHVISRPRRTYALFLEGRAATALAAARAVDARFAATAPPVPYRNPYGVSVNKATATAVLQEVLALPISVTRGLVGELEACLATHPTNRLRLWPASLPEVFDLVLMLNKASPKLPPSSNDAMTSSRNRVVSSLQLAYQYARGLPLSIFLLRSNDLALLKAALETACCLLEDVLLHGSVGGRSISAPVITEMMGLLPGVLKEHVRQVLKKGAPSPLASRPGPDAPLSVWLLFSLEEAAFSMVSLRSGEVYICLEPLLLAFSRLPKAAMEAGCRCLDECACPRYAPGDCCPKKVAAVDGIDRLKVRLRG